jgi:hypothetical protein
VLPYLVMVPPALQHMGMHWVMTRNMLPSVPSLIGT